jgi:type IV pilus assembly protein PilO
MNLSDPRTQKILLGVLAFVIVSYFWYTSYYSEYAETIDQRQEELAQLNEHLNRIRQKAKSYESLRQEYLQLRARYRNVELLLPEEKEIPSFLNQLHSAAKMTNTELIEITPEAPLPVDFYLENPFLVTAQTSFHNLGEFFANVANFPFIVNVANVTLTGTQQSATVETYDPNRTLNVTMRLTTYNIQEAQRLQPVEF